MLGAGIVMLIAAITLCLTLVIFADKAVDKWILIVMLIFSIIGTIITENNIHRSDPKAIDVYRGRTTLEITYRDSIPIDSVVVYKFE